MTSRIGSATTLLFVVSVVILTLSFDPTGNAKSAQHHTGLTFADRVRYQRTIEEIYWRHRIWPKENLGAKPSLSEIMSAAQVEGKVRDYMRNSRALELYWQRPITPEELQAEIDRIAHNTRQPDTLREIFAALGNDAAVIAECVARPVLAERLVRDLSARDEQFRTQVAALRSSSAMLQVNSGDTDPRASADDDSKTPRLRTMAANEAAKYRLPAIISTPNTCFDNWVATGDPSPAGVAGRYLHTAIWTGSEMIVWGGNNGPGYTGGGRYNPTTDSWSLVSTTDEPAYRDYHTAVWTGTEMIVWGGINPIPNTYTDTGGRYNPATDTWTPTDATSAPEARAYHTAVWTGTQMIVWGGAGNAGELNSGGTYTPNSDSWMPTSIPSIEIAARSNHTAVWTGTEMIIWGGVNSFIPGFFLNSGGRYEPITDSWSDTDPTTAPAARWFHTAVWTGSEMIVWGGENEGGVLNTGGRYDPITSTWAATTTTNAPEARRYHTAVWSGSEMIVWGGAPFYPTNTGGRYNLSADSWTATTTNGAPEARFWPTAVWTGNEMIVWGGVDAAGNGLATGGRYCGQATVVVQSATTRKTHGSAGTFDVNLPLTGTPGIECRTGGPTNDYTMIVTFSSNVTVTGSPQAEVISGTATVGSGGVSNGGMVTVNGNVVTVPLTNFANAQTISLRLNVVNGSTNVDIPMSLLIGDTNANGSVNAGDVAQTKGRLGQTVNVTNFRSDVNANGTLNAGDAAIVKQNSGTSLPP